jgi:hypothetical protein
LIVLRRSFFTLSREAPMRVSVVLFLLVLLLPPDTVHADRITQMNQSDLCTYTAKLQVAGYYYFEQGKPREEVKIVWHGDETQNEIDFVNRTLTTPTSGSPTREATALSFFRYKRSAISFTKHA